MKASALAVKLEFLCQAVLRYPLPEPCPHCGARAADVVARKYWAVRVQRCRVCGLSYTRPVYRSLLGERFYDLLYAAEGSTTEMPTPEELRALKANGFAGSDKNFRPIAEKLRALSPAKRPRVLEIGSSWGYCLYQFSQLGCDTLGVELGTRRRTFGAEQLGIRAVPGLDALAPDDRFDLIFSAHALEHFTDLRVVFPTLSNRLADGGLLCIEVPNFDLPARGKEVLPIIGAVHPLGFDSAFFARNLPRAGLRIEGMFADWDDFPSRPRDRSDGNVVIVLARKPASKS
jgi:SAM-dependent methyltransferase